MIACAIKERSRCRCPCAASSWTFRFVRFSAASCSGGAYKARMKPHSIHQTGYLHTSIVWKICNDTVISYVTVNRCWRIGLDSMYDSRTIFMRTAEAAGLGKHLFCRMFQQQTGMTPFYYLRTKRSEEAAKDLRQNGLPVHTIAMLTGFDNSSYFGKVFRRLVGVSLQQFRDGKVEVPVNALVIE